MKRRQTAANRTNSMDPKPTPPWLQRLLLDFTNNPFGYPLFLVFLMLVLLVGRN